MYYLAACYSKFTSKRNNDFYENLVISVQVFDTMKEIDEYVMLTLDTLPGVRADLVRIDEGNPN